jgi:transposase-like protein
MSATAPSVNPLGEIETLTRELTSLETLLSERKISSEEFEILSSQIKARISNAESSAYLRARTDESIAKKLRAANYLEPKVQQVCYHFINGPKTPLEPMFEADRIPRYFIEPEKGMRIPVDAPLLRRLADIGILRATLFEKILMCPKCGTPSNVYARFKCPQCGSTDILINRMVEHLACGTIHEESVLNVGTGGVCPTCKKVVKKPSEQRFIGVMCSCGKCRAHFEDPSQSFFCRKCEVDFNLTTGIITDSYIYQVNEQMLEEARSQIGIPAIAQVLQKNGFEVSVPGKIGDGARQFSILARRGTKSLAVDIDTNDTEVGVEPVLALFVKLLEAKPDSAVFGALPRLSIKAREVAQMHGIKVAEGLTPSEVADKILDIARADLPSAPSHQEASAQTGK